MKKNLATILVLSFLVVATIIAASNFIKLKETEMADVTGEKIRMDEKSVQTQSAATVQAWAQQHPTATPTFEAVRQEVLAQTPMTTEVPTTTPEPTNALTSPESMELTFGEPQSFEDGLITISGFPQESHPVRWGDGVVQDNSCGEGAEESCWILADPGVISFDFQTVENESNLSAVLSGGANVDNLMENVTGTYLCPEGGYIKVTYPQASIVMQQLELIVEVEAAAETNYTFLARCLYAEENGNSTDRNIVMDFFTDHPGRVKIMRYPVNPAWSGFFSFVHLEEDLVNGHGQLRANADNCGNSGCSNSYVILLDLNHKTISIFFHSIINGWELIYSNANQP